ncbi:MAG TPA: YdeI/OmpD-associated family protein [Terriglobales bacterium]|nr:YdeI/OmpD-associated family protein [Terriglobales bacterium]
MATLGAIRSGTGGGIQYIVVNAAARRHAGVKAGDVVTIVLEPDTEKRDIEIPIQLRRVLGAKLTEKLNRLAFSHKKEFVVWYSGAKKEETRARRVEKMKQMLSSGKVIS